MRLGRKPILDQTLHLLTVVAVNMAYQAAREVADDRSQPSRSSTILRGINQRVRETEGSERSNDSILSAVDFDGVQGEAALPNDFSEANGGHHHDQEGNLDLHEDNRAWVGGPLVTR